MPTERYSIKKDNDRLIFRTSSFRAERPSVLHRGIYNYELASSLSAVGICALIYIILAFNYRIIFIHYLVIGGIFIVVFISFRKFIFREKTLTVIFDKSGGNVCICRPRFIGEDTENIPLSNIESVEVGSRKVLPENIDGIKFVQKISAQHGSAVPGLGEEAEFVTLSLKLSDGTERIIYAGKIEGKIDGEPEVPLKEISDFLGTK